MDLFNKLIKVKKVARYRLMDTIGEGSYGKVKRAVHLDTKEEVAIKVLDRKRIEEARMVHELRKEIEIMKKLNSKHTVDMIEAIYTDKQIYVVVEMCRGGEVFAKIVDSERGLDTDMARRYFRQLVDALEWCHSHNVAHGDLKPQNLLLDSRNNIKISDFGFSCFTQVEGATAERSVAYGTLSYMAPEVHRVALKELPRYNAQLADIWAVGVILFVMCAGYIPWVSADENVRRNLILNCEYECPEWFEPELRELISMILQVDPHKRASLMQMRNSAWMQAKQLPPSSPFVPRRRLTTDVVVEGEIADAPPIEKHETDHEALPYELTREQVLQILRAGSTRSVGAVPNKFATSVLSTRRPADAVAELKVTLGALGHTVEEEGEDFRMRVGVGETVYVCQVFSVTGTPYFLIVFIQRRGDMVRWFEVYRAIRSRLQEGGTALQHSAEVEDAVRSAFD